MLHRFRGDLALFEKDVAVTAILALSVGQRGSDGSVSERSRLRDSRCVSRPLLRYRGCRWSTEESATVSALKWEDVEWNDDGVSWIHVTRAVRRSFVGTTKTEESVADVPTHRTCQVDAPRVEGNDRRRVGLPGKKREADADRGICRGRELRRVIAD